MTDVALALVIVMLKGSCIFLMQNPIQDTSSTLCEVPLMRESLRHEMNVMCNNVQCNL